jgi:hypothetical protein
MQGQKVRNNPLFGPAHRSFFAHCPFMTFFAIPFMFLMPRVAGIMPADMGVRVALLPTADQQANTRRVPVSYFTLHIP